VDCPVDSFGKEESCGKHEDCPIVRDEFFDRSVHFYIYYIVIYGY